MHYYVFSSVSFADELKKFCGSIGEINKKRGKPVTVGELAGVIERNKFEQVWNLLLLTNSKKEDGKKHKRV